MPVGEPGGPDTEGYYRFDDIEHDKTCKDLPIECECGKFMEIANSVFMQYLKTDNGFKPLPKQNVDFGGGLERLLAAVEEKSDVFTTSLFLPIIKTIEDETRKSYKTNAKEIRIITDHLTAAIFIANSKIKPSNKDQGYILRRLLRRAFDNFYTLEGSNISFVLEKIVNQYKDTDPDLLENFEEIKLTILEEENNYKETLKRAKAFIEKSSFARSASGGPRGNIKEISPDQAFQLYSTHGLSPTQIKSLGYEFDDQSFARLMEEHQALSRKGAEQKFKGGLADHSELTIMGHTATHLLHKSLRDLFGNHVHQTGSNITTERIRFDFSFERMPTPQEVEKIENTINEKIQENLPVHFEIMPLAKAKEIGAIGLFDDKYQEDVKVYFVGKDEAYSARGSSDLSPQSHSRTAYSIEFCGGPHVNFTGELKKFKIIKVENIGKGQKRIYAKINTQL
jgi:alanyl-tRNA synthetase